MYVLDSNVLIDCHRLDFPISTNGLFWDNMLVLGQNGIVKIPEEVYSEVLKGSDTLKDYVKANKDAFFLPTQEAFPNILAVLNVYDPTMQTQVEDLKADPYVIAHAISGGYTVVTGEMRALATNPRKKKVPTICDALNVRCIRVQGFIWEMYNNPTVRRHIRFTQP